MRWPFRAAMAALFAWPVACPVAAAEPPTPVNLDQVLAALDTSTRFVASYDILFRTSRVSFLDTDTGAGTGDKAGQPAGPAGSWKKIPEPIPDKWREAHLVRQWFDGRRYRTETFHPNADVGSPPMTVQVWDGELCKERTPSTGEIRDSVGTHSFFQEYGVPYPYCYRYGEGMLPYVEMIRKRNTTVSVEGGLVKVDAGPTPRVTMGKTGFRFWLDPRRGGLPVAIELYRSRQPRITRVENTIEEVLPAVWAPTRSVAMSYVTDEGSEFYNQPFCRYELVLDRGFSKFNVPVDPAVFQLEFNPGSVVYDRVRNMSYVAGRDRVEDHLDDIAMQGRAGLEELAQGQPPVGSPARVSSRWQLATTLLWVNAVLLAVVVVGVAVRRWWTVRAAPSAPPEAPPA